MTHERSTSAHDQVCWRREQVGECLVGTPTGALTSATYRDFRDMLVKLAVAATHTVIVRIDDLDLPDAHALTAFSSAALRVSDWPGVAILIVTSRSAQRAELDAAGVSRFVPVFATVADAVAAAGRAPARRRAVVDLDHDLFSARRARLFVRSVCQRWRLGGVVADAEQIVTELVENAVLHTASRPRLRLDLRSGVLSIAVRDDSVAEAVVRERVPGALDDRGGGLRIVAGSAKNWGCSPCLDGGKVVWAALRTTDRRAELR